jgi:hypothetical protein
MATGWSWLRLTEIGCVLLLAAGASGFLAVEAEVMGHSRRLGADGRSARRMLGHYIWSSHAPIGLRRRYVLSAIAIALASLCLGGVVLLSGLDPGRRMLGSTMAFSIALGIPLGLTRKIMRRGL